MNGVRAILHVDMDAFYAAVEMHDRPELASEAVIVGGLGRRGVVSTANYRARESGVHSAMPMAKARQLCPQARFIAPRMARYREVSAQVFDTFRRYTPLVEGLSLDEAFLDITASQRLFGGPVEIARQLKADIHGQTGLTASVGLAHNKFLAKLASDLRKPDGLVCVDPGRLAEFLDPMPIRRLWGIGPRTEPRLRAIGILTFGQLRRADPSVLRSVLGNRSEHFRGLAQGCDDREVIPDSPDRSISHEITFDEDVVAREELLGELMHLAEAVARRLRQRGLGARTVTVKIRDPAFHTVTRSRSLRAGTSSTRTIYQVARALFETWRQTNRSTPVRLLGVGTSGLEECAPQAEGWVENTPDRRLDTVLDTINQRYGETRIVHGQSLRRPKSGS